MGTTSMIVKMKGQPGARDQILAALVAAKPAAEAEEGTEVYSFHLDKADPDTLWVFELYADDAALGVHGGSEAVATLFAEVGPLLAEPPLLAMAEYAEGFGLPR